MNCKSRKTIIWILPEPDGCKKMSYWIRVRSDKPFLAKLGLPHMNWLFSHWQLYANCANIMGYFAWENVKHRVKVLLAPNFPCFVKWLWSKRRIRMLSLLTVIFLDTERWYALIRLYIFDSSTRKGTFSFVWHLICYFDNYLCVHCKTRSLHTL
jgi:hypothetical protein